MTTTMQLIAKQTVGAGGAASVTFSSIPQTFTDLKVLISARDTVDNQASIRFNSSTTGYSNIRLQGTGSVAQSTTDSSTSKGIIAYGVNQTSSRPANTFGNSEVYIPNYAGSTNKSFSSDGVEENNGATAYSKLFAGLLSNTAAITSITLSAEGIFEELSEFTLYGISNSTTTQASTVPYASGGDVITTDGTYWYHTFLYSGTFTPLKNLTCDYLVVAGGGSGGVLGGGGAGGFRTSIGGTALSLTAQAYVATIGAGGTRSAQQGTNGSDSVFSTITSTGGGGGGGESSLATSGGFSGGSGGGAGGDGGSSPQAGAGGGGASAVGNNGGTGSNAGGAGNTPSTSPSQGNNGGTGGGGTGTGGAGGAGTASSISGTSITYAGGGGGGGYILSGSGTGGAGGAGGGGRGGGGNTNGPISGTANTGGGGGGMGLSSSGSTPPNSTQTAGGSGIIVVRYAV
jgi:hypothetical protein